MFQGFSPETFDFLWGIRMNNDREWFLPHKDQYVKYLYEPMKALGAELFRPFLDRPGNLLKVSRIYRDARLHPATPYKESLWICIRRDVEWWAENPCLYFEIRPEGASYGLVYWHPRTDALERFRRDIAARPDPFLSLVARTEQAVGLPLTAETYKRPKVPEDSRLAPYFAWKGDIECAREVGAGPELFTAALSRNVGKMFEDLVELYDYFAGLAG